MNVEEYISITGEHEIFVDGRPGQMEVVLSIPEDMNTNYIAFIGHPHSLQGGNMNNKVVTTLVRTLKSLGVASMRFNFRGVGKSAGSYDAGIGESEDMLRLVALFGEKFTNIIFAGFSFGAYVAYRAASLHENALLIAIAPPVHHYDFTEFVPKSKAEVIVHGDADEVVPYELVVKYVESLTGKNKFISFPECSHFFHGNLVELKEELRHAICECTSL